jgi:hypothetical protein
MKQAKGPGKTHGPRKPVAPQRIPLSVLAEATAGRDKIREIAYPVRAARQSQRRVERTAKHRNGG